MTPNEPGYLDALIGYHLGTADAADRAVVEAAVNASDEARRRSESLNRLLRPLATYAVKPLPRLVDGVMGRIAESQRTIKLPGGSGRPSEPMAGCAAGGGPILSKRDLLSLAAAIALFFGLFMPGYRAARSSAQRSLCLDQMRTLGSAFGGYSQAYAGMLPYTGQQPRSQQWPLDRAAPLPVPNTIQVLLEGQFVPGRRYLFCPTGKAAEYSQQVVIRPYRIDALSPRFPIAADPNPLVEHGRFVPSIEPRNSDAHGRNAGQIVLQLDGSAAWRTRPTVGIAEDDIFRINNRREYDARERLSAISDTFLIP